MDITYHIYDRIEELHQRWHLTSEESVFMSPAFYTALENAPPSGTTFYYVVANNGQKDIGLFYFQLKKIELDKSLRLDEQAANGWASKALLLLKKVLARQVRAYTLVGGNMTLTGTYGQWVTDEYLPQKWEILSEAAHNLVAQLKKSKKKVRAVLLKDYYISNRPTSAPASFTEFLVQPNMILELNKSWHSFDDYLSSMKSKYRTRARRARKKAAGLTRRVLDLTEIKLLEKDIKRLYKNVADGAGFNLFTLPDDYFWSLQHHLGSHMKLHGYFDGEDNLVGFYTSIKNHNDLDAHFLGYDVDCNKHCQLYLNMLYDLIDEAISEKADTLIMSRTALEIKSSVGAVPHDMFLYMKVTNNILNYILPRALRYFVPKVDWKPRSPFP